MRRLGRAHSNPARRRSRVVFGERIGNFVAVLGIGLGEFALAALAHGVGQFAFEVAEERKGLGRAPFLAHEQQRRRRLQQQHCQRRFDRCGLRQRRQALAERAIADLVVVLDEIDESGARQIAARLAAQLIVAMGRWFALIGETLRMCAHDMAPMIAVVAVIALGLAGQQHVPGVVIVVVPLRAIAAGRRVFVGREQTCAIVVVFQNEMDLPAGLARRARRRLC